MLCGCRCAALKLKRAGDEVARVLEPIGGRILGKWGKLLGQTGCPFREKECPSYGCRTIEEEAESTERLESPSD